MRPRNRNTAWSTWALLLLGSLLTAWLVARGSGPLGCPIGDESDLGCARGFSGREHDAAGAFRWTEGTATILLPGGTWRPAELMLALTAPRPANTAPPSVTIEVRERQIPLPPDTRPRRVTLLLPETPAQLRVTSDTFAADDGRALGVKVYAVQQRAAGQVTPDPWNVLGLIGIGWLGLTLARIPSLAYGRGGRGERFWRFGGALLAWLLTAGLCWWQPLRVVPYVPAAGALAALLALAQRRWGALRIPAPLLAALLLGAALDGLVVAQAVPRAALPLVIAAQLTLLLGALAWARRWAGTLPTLLGVVVLMRLLGFAARLLAAQAASDPDTLLFYSYGRAALELGVPLVEYPSGALLPWMLLAQPKSAELFALLLPLLNLGCDLVVVWALWTVGEPRAELPQSHRAHRERTELADNNQRGKETDRQRGSRLFPLCYALSPLLLPFWHGKYDPLPTALLLGGLALWWRGRNFWAGAALGLGGAVKWVPWLALPFLGAGTLQATGNTPAPPAGRDRWMRILLLGAGFLLAVAAASLPFALRDAAAFLAPYRVQGSRPMIGESIWFPLAALLDPALLGAIDKPWSGVWNPPFGRWLLIGAQLLALLSLGIAQLRARTAGRTVALAALAPAVFLLLNRVYSPQYILLISACALLAAVALRLRRPLLLCGLLGLAQAANLLVWPNTMPWWLWASVIHFGALVGVVVWLVLASETSTTTEPQSTPSTH